MIKGFILGAIDWNAFTQNPVDWFAYPFVNVIGSSFWVALFAVVIGMAWVLSKNVTVTVAAILITFGFFGGTQYFISSPEYSLFFAVICVIGIAGTILELFISSKR